MKLLVLLQGLQPGLVGPAFGTLLGALAQPMKQAALGAGRCLGQQPFDQSGFAVEQGVLRADDGARRARLALAPASAKELAVHPR